MRRAVLVTLVTIAIVATAAPRIWAGINDIGSECAAGFGTPVVGSGSRDQTATQYRLFVNEFSRPSAKGGCRADVQGLITFSGDNDDAVVNNMLYRAFDPLDRRYYFFSLDRALSADEKQRIEQDLGQFLGRTSLVEQLPMWVDGLAVAYNLACTNDPVKLSSLALSQIYAGLTTKWNDGIIVQDNPSLATCDETIRVAVRADASENTALLKDYLSKRNPQWGAYMSPSLNAAWPSTLIDPCRGIGDQGMAQCVAGQAGSIGYVSFGRAFKQGLRAASVQNRTGFVSPSFEQCTQAASLPTYPARADLDWSHASLTDPIGGYPICGLQFGVAFASMSVAYGSQIAANSVRTVKDYLKWMTQPQTQERLTAYGKAPLPERLRSVSQSGADAITFGPPGS